MKVGKSFIKLYMVLSIMIMSSNAFPMTTSRKNSIAVFVKVRTGSWISKESKETFQRYPGRLLSTSLHLTSKTPVKAIINNEQIIHDMLYRIRQVNTVPSEIRDSLLEFRVDGIKLGQVRPNIAKLLCSFYIGKASNDAAFKIEWDDDSKSYLTLASACGTTFESRSEAISAVTKQMKDQGTVTGWRDEMFPVTSTFYSEPVFAMERAAVSFLGVPEYGVHIIGLVQKKSSIDENVDDNTINSLQMWMARRSANKSKWPGMMDHIAAGGQPIGLSLTENVVKECFEEAGIPESITRKGIRPTGAVTYENYVPKKDVVERIVLFCFDLYLPSDFKPKPVDGEVEQFYLYGIDQVLELMAEDYHDPMKPNCYMVVIDFLIRHGYVSPDVPGYLDVVRELRTGVCQ